MTAATTLSLIELYAARAVVSIDTKSIEQSTGRTLAALTGDREFTALHSCVRARKAHIEAIDPTTSAAQQRRACFAELMRLSEDIKERRDAAHIFNELVKRALAPSWAPVSEREAYELAAEIVLNWHDYFLSYTRRDCANLNHEFARWLRAHYGISPSAQRHRASNLVAEMVYRELTEKNGLRGYFDTNELRDGVHLTTEIRASLSTTIALVQLVQQAALCVPAEGKPNWPFEEFSYFTQLAEPLPGAQRLHLFLVAADNLDNVIPAALNATYRDEWLRVMNEFKYVLFDPNLPRMNPTKVRHWFNARARSIREIKSNILDSLMA